MNYNETIDYLFQKLPMFSRIGEQAIKKDLFNTHELCAYLDQPQNKFPTIHIAGTNGKGSVSHMLASILQEAGYKTGLYTSPHLKDFRERIKINGIPCEEEFVIDFTERIKNKIETIEPSFFEITVAMAFDYFAQQKVDIAIIETGLGGRLDSTNIIDPILSIITNISLDHQHLLGNTLDQIAFEKAGIIKQHTPVLIGRKNNITNHVFSEKARLSDAPLFFTEDSVHLNHAENVKNCLKLDVKINGIPKVYYCDLSVQYQSENTCTVLAAVNILNQNSTLILNDLSVHAGLLNVVSNTQFYGRWQLLEHVPKTIADVAHNEDGIMKVISQLETESFQQLHFILGVVKDKDIDKILQLLPKDALYYFTEPPIPRKLEVDILKEKAQLYGLVGNAYMHPKDALKAARIKAKKDDFILVSGSFFVVAEVI